MADPPDPEPGRARTVDVAVVPPWVALTQRVLVRVRWFGAWRLVSGALCALAAVGFAWWLLRTPAPPIEATLPVATHGADAGAGTDVGVAPSEPPNGPSAPPTSAVPAVVHVAGAVVAPGVYQLPPGSRVADAIAAAGGASATADVDVLNLAAPVADGDRIGVPLAGSGVPAAAGHLHAGTAQSAAGGSAPVNINSASAEQLDELPGIGPATAAAIVSHREQHGPFASVDDLEAVRGIGPAKIEALRAAVVL